MFFRREKQHVNSFSERIDHLKPYKMTTKDAGSGRTLVMRDDIGALVTHVPNDRPHVRKAGLVVNGEVAELVNAGYQQFWLTTSNKRVPALADQLKRLHEFEEDLKEGLELPSLYNTSLGTTSALHLYDRVKERDDAAHVARPWEKELSGDDVAIEGTPSFTGRR